MRLPSQLLLIWAALGFAGTLPAQPLNDLVRHTVAVEEGSGVVVAEGPAGFLVVTAAHVAYRTAPPDAGRAGSSQSPPGRSASSTSGAAIQPASQLPSLVGGAVAVGQLARRTPQRKKSDPGNRREFRKCTIIAKGCDPYRSNGCDVSREPDLALLFCPDSTGDHAGKMILSPGNESPGALVGLVGNLGGKGELSLTPAYAPLIRVSSAELEFFSFANSFGFDIGGFSGGAVYDQRGRMIAIQQRVTPDSLLQAIAWNSVEHWIDCKLDSKLDCGQPSDSLSATNCREARLLWQGKANRIHTRPESVPTPARGETEIAVGAQAIMGETTSQGVQIRAARSIGSLRNLQAAFELLFVNQRTTIDPQFPEAGSKPGLLMPSVSALYPIGQDIPWLRGSQVGGLYVGAGYGFLQMTNQSLVGSFAEQFKEYSKTAILEYGWRWRKARAPWGVQFSGRSIWVKAPILGVPDRLDVLSGGVLVTLGK